MLQITQNFRATGIRLAAAVLLGSAALAAQARDIDMTAPNVSAAPGNDVVVNISFSTGVDTPITSFLFGLDYDSTRLSLVDGTASVGGVAVTLADLVAFGGLVTPGTVAGKEGVSVAFFPNAYVFGDTSAMALTFHLAPGLLPGSQIPVDLLFSSTDESLNQRTDVMKTAVITAVPEPETWLMTLIGLPLAAGWARRSKGSKKRLAAA
jgi:hypothetical protein